MAHNNYTVHHPVLAPLANAAGVADAPAPAILAGTPRDPAHVEAAARDVTGYWDMPWRTPSPLTG